MKPILLTLALLGGFSAAQTTVHQTAAQQTSIMNIPALPLGVTSASSASPAANTPAATGSATTSPVSTQAAGSAGNAAVTPQPAESLQPTSTPQDAAQPPATTSLPSAGKILPGNYKVSLSGPATVQAGQPNTWEFKLSNIGPAPLHLDHGACDVRYEVLDAAGKIVRPDPKNTVCTMQMVILNAQAGQTVTVQKIHWEGKDGAGQVLPAGVYTLHAKYIGGGMATLPASLSVTVR